MNDKNIILQNLFGHKISCFADDHITNNIKLYGLYDREALTLALKILTTIKEPILLDIGANIGNHSLAFSTVAKQIYSFEPVSFIFNKLTENVQQNNIQNIKAFNIGFSDKNSQGLINIDTDGNLGSSSISEIQSNKKEKIVLINGDYFLKENHIKKIDFIKIDIEGHEFYAINGLKETIIKQRPLVMMEWNSEHNKQHFREANTMNEIFNKYDIYSISENEQYDSNYWKGKIFGKIRKKFYRKHHLPVKLNKFIFDNSYSNILLIPSEKKYILKSSKLK